MASATMIQDGRPPPAEVRAQVQRMTASDVFATSPQLSAFLLFVVEAVLRGQGQRLKGYTIGVEVLRRDTTFDPQIDPIVRVEATRLRRAIERYYAGAGIDDPIIIDLPRGGYVPRFSWRELAAQAPTPELVQANEAVLALIALGYKQVDAHKAVHDLQQKGEGEGKSAEELVKLVLKRMAAGR